MAEQAYQDVLTMTGSPEERKAALEGLLHSATEEDKARARQTNVFFIAGEGLPYAKGASAEVRLAAFKQLYALGTDVEKTDEFYYTGLAYACKLNDRASMDEILKYKPNLQLGKHEDSEGECHCMDWKNPPAYTKVALENGHRELALHLLSLGAAPVGVMWCIIHDDLPMLEELLKAGGSLREGLDNEDAPHIIRAKSTEMVRYLHSKGSRCTDATEYLYLLRLYRNEDEAQAREMFVTAGLITPEDVENFDRGGVPKLPYAFNLPYYPNDWLPEDAAHRLFNALCGADAAAQDETVAIILRSPLNEDEKDGYSSSRDATLCAALIIVGDDRFTTQLQKLTPTDRQFARKLLDSGLDSFHSERKADILAAHPRTCQLLGL